MKKSFLIIAVVAMLAASAMAHGPPPTLGDMASAVVAKANATGTSSDGIIVVTHGGGSGGITKLGPGAVYRMLPANERMLN